jgi:phage/plasmid primase-like uncharacterized protein
LSEVARKSLRLEKAGKEWRACCPFHQEKSPSFYINDDKQFFHCFGCGAHGDVVDFVALRDRTDTAGALASLTGGDAPRLTERDASSREKWLREKEEAREKEASAATERARARWEAAHPVEGANAYLERKKVAPHTARIEKGKLLLPVYDEEGEIMSVQTIADDGSKLFAPGAPTSMGRMHIGIHFGTTVICEGFATGASIFEAMPGHVCVTFSKGNMHKIARSLSARGDKIILAADTNAADEMGALARELDCPLIVPRAGSDFNDQANERGLEDVRATFTEGLLAFQNRPPPPEEAPYCSVAFVEAFDFSEEEIPLRPWLVPGALMAGATHILAAPGGTGKSLFTLQFAIMLATGTQWGRWKPKRPCRVLILNAEDDIDEQRRRLAAARTVMGLSGGVGGLLLAENPSSILTASMDEKTRRPVATPLVGELASLIRFHQIDAVIVDPFAETFEGDENSNNDTKWAMKVWRDDIARATGCAVYLVHHTTKNAADKAGSADAVRGAGALVNSARLAATMFNMTEIEATALDIKPEDRFRYVKYDDAKSNRSLIGARQWFEKVSVVIKNGEQGDSQGGDEVGALRPWEHSGIASLDTTDLLKLLGALEVGFVDSDGVCTDQPFTPTQQGGSKRYVGLLIEEMFGVGSDRAKTIFRTLMDRGIIEVRDYRDSEKGRSAKGVFPGPKAGAVAELAADEEATPK